MSTLYSCASIANGDYYGAATWGFLVGEPHPLVGIKGEEHIIIRLFSLVKTSAKSNTCCPHTGFLICVLYLQLWLFIHCIEAYYMSLHKNKM